MRNRSALPGNLRVGGVWANIPWGAALLFVLCLATIGGASKTNEIVQIPVRVTAILVVALLWPVARRRPMAELRPLALLLAGAAGLVVLQLIPLPPSIWSALPGRSLYMEAIALVGGPQPWRPVNLVPNQGWNALLALLPPAATLIITTALGRSRVQITVTVVAAVAVVSALIGVAQLGEGQLPLLRPYRGFTVGQPSGVFANRNHQALLLALALPALAVWASGRPTMRVHRAFASRDAIALGSSIVIAMASLATGSRAGVALLLPAGMSAAYFLATSFRDDARARRMIWAATAVTIVAAIAAMVLADRSASVARLFTGDAVSDKRTHNFPALLRMAQTFFPIGSGFGSFDPVFRRFEPYETLTFTYFNEAHDDLLQVLIEGGLGGALLMLGYFALWVRWSWRAWRDNVAQPTLARLGSIVTLLTIIASAVDYPLRTPVHAALFTLATAWMAIGAAKAAASDAAPGAALINKGNAPARPRPGLRAFTPLP